MTAGGRSVVIEADGGSRGNPGPAGYGAVVLDADNVDGEPLATAYASIGRATNNVAEYRALIAGLTEAGLLGATEVHVRMDSRLVVEQMAGRWRVKSADLAVLREQASRLADGFARIDYEWIPRERNRRADALANAAMDEAAAGGTPTAAGESPAGTPATPVRSTPAAPSAGPAGSVPSAGSAVASWMPRSGSATRLLLLRHGQTELSIDRRYSGRGNPPLTETGRRQAAAAAQRLASDRFAIDAIVSSPLGRAMTTAQHVADRCGLSVVVDDGFIETDFGKWEGLTFAEAKDRYPQVHDRWVADTSVAPPGGESFDAVAERVDAAVARTVERYAGQTVLVVSHVTPIKSVLRRALEVGPSLLFRLHLDLASLSRADFFPHGGASVRLVNDTAHLEGRVD